MNGLVVSEVSHGYGSGGGRVEVLHDVDLTVSPGELVALLGPSGSGKTTLCHLAAGFESPERGTVEADGRGAAAAADWSVVAVVPQQLGLLAGLTVADNVLLPAYRCGATGDAFPALAAALDLGGLAHRPVDELSLGEQQRVAVARALVLSPRVLVLDEPTGHQDDDRAALVTAVLRGAAGSGTAVLLASHDPRAQRIADRVLHLDEGRIRGESARTPWS